MRDSANDADPTSSANERYAMQVVMRKEKSYRARGGRRVTKDEGKGRKVEVAFGRSRPE